MKHPILPLVFCVLLGAPAAWAQPGVYDHDSPSTATQPQRYAATAPLDETSLPIDRLLADAESLAAAGEAARAAAIYDQVLKAAPRNAQAYRGRARALAALGDTAQAQADYNRFLKLDPVAPERMRQELQLFQRSGYPSPDTVDAASSDASATNAPYPNTAALAQSALPGPVLPDPAEGRQNGPVTAWNARAPVVDPGREAREALRADLNFALARDALREGGIATALHYARISDLSLPRVRNHALMAQAYLIEGDYRSAAAEARAVAAAGPLQEWPAIYGDYNFSLPRFVVALKRLEDYARLNSTSADAHFLLGYEYLFAGQPEAAHEQIGIATVLQPWDRVAKTLLERQGVEVTAVTDAATPSPSPPPARLGSTGGDILR
jgi:Flp pilus assembly protein TadD